MTEILALLQVIQPLVTKTTLRQMSRVIQAMLSMSGRITMLGISRWTGSGGSYRTIQRWYHTPLLWLQIQWLFFAKHVQQPSREYIVAGDEVVFGKAGKETYGLGRFFSSIQNRSIAGLSFFTFSVMDVQERRSYPMQSVQMIKEKEEENQKKKVIQFEKRSPGRPKGSKNKKGVAILGPELLRIQLRPRRRRAANPITNGRGVHSTVSPMRTGHR